MEPIISPWLIYFAEMCDVFNFLLILLLIVSIIADLYFSASVIDNNWELWIGQEDGQYNR